MVTLQDKKTLKLGPEDYLYVEGFALNVFAKADKQDRAGRADLYVGLLFWSINDLILIDYQWEIIVNT